MTEVAMIWDDPSIMETSLTLTSKHEAVGKAPITRGKMTSPLIFNPVTPTAKDSRLKIKNNMCLHYVCPVYFNWGVSMEGSGADLKICSKRGATGVSGALI